MYTHIVFVLKESDCSLIDFSSLNMPCNLEKSIPNMEEPMKQSRVHIIMKIKFHQWCWAVGMLT